MGGAALALAMLTSPAALPAQPAGGAATPAVAACDRACLTRAMTGFLDALVSRDPAKANLAPNVRYTEDGVELPVGEGLWGTATGLGRYRHDFADPVTGNAAVFTIVDERGHKSILSARVKVVGGSITEAEVIVSRAGVMGGGMGDAGIHALETAGAPEALWTQTVPPAERLSREELRRVANQYFVGLEKNDGKGDYPFSDDCERLEGGLPTTNRTEPLGPAGGGYGQDLMRMGCKAQFEQGYYRWLDRIRNRRFVLIDPERGVVFSFVFFDHSGTIPEVTLRSGRTVKVAITQPFSWELAEAFKITNGKIRRIEAAMKQAPYGMGPNWPEDGEGGGR